MNAGAVAAPGSDRPVTFRDALRFWAKLGCISFGGPAAQIALMHEELVVRRRWLAADRFDHALSFCMLLPGPEAQQLATYSGWLLHGTRGGLAAGLLFVLPSALLLFLLSLAYAMWGSLPAVEGALWGGKAVVLALVLEAVVRVGKRALRQRVHAAFAVAAFVAIFVFAVPFPVVVLTAAIVGIWLRTGPAAPTAPSPPAQPMRTLRVLAVGASLWIVPFLLLTAAGPTTALAREQYLFFSGAALVTFGGAYAVLAYVSQAAVTSFGWITSAQAIDGLALAETTPGPLIMVLQFVGFMTGWNHPGELSPLAAATIGAVVTTWATFLPSMLFIFLGAPFVETLRQNRTATSAMQGVTAAVLGVLVNLAVVFGSAVLWPGVGEGHFDWLVLLLAGAAFAALASRRVHVLVVIAVGAVVGLLRAWL